MTFFAPGGSFTVGAEDEVFLVDGNGALVPSLGEAVVSSWRDRADIDSARVSGELYSAQIEFATSVCADGGEIACQLGSLRSELAARGVRALAAGLHPQAPFGEVDLGTADRYTAIGATFAGLLRTPTAAFQVHVGLPDPASAMLAYRGLRHRLVVLQALASNSPFWHGRDSGMASARWAVISSYPRGGIPPVLRSYDEYVALLGAVQAAAEVPDYTQVWWDARLQPRLGTIEVRVMDAQPSLSVAAGLSALTQGMVRCAVEQPLAVDVPSEVLAENSFRAARYGLETTIADVDGTMRPLRVVAARMLEEARDVLRTDDLDAPLQEVDRLLADETSYARQRRLHAETGMEAVLDDLTVGAGEV
ncbi:MAG: YbdK family carboxylate-amine ligase [Marmoricola sp.]